MSDKLQGDFFAAGGEGEGFPDLFAALRPSENPHIPDLKDSSSQALARLARELKDEPGIIAFLLGAIKDLQKERDAAIIANRTSPVTGIYNKVALSVILDHQIKSSSRQGAKPFSLIYADLSLFKDINDKHGHETGDAALRAVARHLEKHCRQGDVVVHLSGDEFAIVLIECDEKGAGIAKARFQETFKGFTFNHEGLALPLGINMGVACYRQGEAAEDFIQRADAAMQAAKQADPSRVGRARGMPATLDLGPTVVSYTMCPGL